jgi:hypothetical protein
MDALINVVLPVFGIILTGYFAGRFGGAGAGLSGSPQSLRVLLRAASRNFRLHGPGANR